jgi:hypothetical protein
VGASTADTGSFRASVRSISGAPTKARVSYIAVTPSSDGSAYRKVTIMGAVQTVRAGGRVDFGAGYPTSPLGLLCSVVVGGSAIAAAAGDQSDAGFTVLTAAAKGGDAGAATLIWIGIAWNR